MSVGILLITHAPLGEAMLTAARYVLGPLPLRTATVGLAAGDDPDTLMPAVRRALGELDQGAGVLVLSDVYGASPSNLAARSEYAGTEVRRVSGLSLPMLLRVMNYPEQSLDELAATAVSGGRAGIVSGHA